MMTPTTEINHEINCLRACACCGRKLSIYNPIIDDHIDDHIIYHHPYHADKVIHVQCIMLHWGEHLNGHNKTDCYSS